LEVVVGTMSCTGCEEQEQAYWHVGAKVNDGTYDASSPFFYSIVTA